MNDRRERARLGANVIVDGDGLLLGLGGKQDAAEDADRGGVDGRRRRAAQIHLSLSLSPLPFSLQHGVNGVESENKPVTHSRRSTKSEEHSRTGEATRRTKPTEQSLIYSASPLLPCRPTVTRVGSL